MEGFVKIILVLSGMFKILTLSKEYFSTNVRSARRQIRINYQLYNNIVTVITYEKYQKKNLGNYNYCGFKKYAFLMNFQNLAV